MQKSFPIIALAATFLIASNASAADAPPAAPSLGALLQSGVYQEETVGNLDAAAKIYQQLLDQAGTNRAYAAQAALRLGMIQLKQKQTDQGIATLTRLGTDYPEQKELVAKANAQLELAGAPPARTVSAADKRAAENLAANAWKLWSQRKLPEAEDLFTQASEKDPTSANIWNGLGWSQFNQGKPQNARESFEKAVALDPKAAAAWNGLGWIAKNDGKTDDALAAWEKSYNALPTATAALSGLASTYAEKRDYDNAILWYNRWLDAEPHRTQTPRPASKKRKRPTKNNRASARVSLAGGPPCPVVPKPRTQKQRSVLPPTRAIPAPTPHPPGAPAGWPVLLLFLAAILIPTCVILWFTNVALENEQLAVRQRIMEFYQAKLWAVRGTIIGTLTSRVNSVIYSRAHPAPRNLRRHRPGP